MRHCTRCLAVARNTKESNQVPGAITTFLKSFLIKIITGITETLSLNLGSEYRLFVSPLELGVFFFFENQKHKLFETHTNTQKHLSQCMGIRV